MIVFKPIEGFAFDDCVIIIDRIQHDEIGHQAQYDRLLSSIVSQEKCDFPKNKAIGLHDSAQNLRIEHIETMCR